MSDIFISYANEDRDRVEPLAKVLEEKGWSVWWDRRIPIGLRFAQVIEEALERSKSIVVVWTKTSVKSEWVHNEAAYGMQRNILLPLLLDEVNIPFEFRRVQAARMIDWKPESYHVGLEELVRDIMRILGPPTKMSEESDAKVLDQGKGEDKDPSIIIPLEDAKPREHEVSGKTGSSSERQEKSNPDFSAMQSSEIQTSSINSEHSSAAYSGINRLLSLFTLELTTTLILGFIILLVVGGWLYTKKVGDESKEGSELEKNPSVIDYRDSSNKEISSISPAAETQDPILAVVKILSEDRAGLVRLGTGFIVKVDVDKERLYIITASHVVIGDSNPRVIFHSDPHGQVLTRKINEEFDNRNGFALLFVDGKEWREVPDPILALPLATTDMLEGGTQAEVIGIPRIINRWGRWFVSIPSRSEGDQIIFEPEMREGMSGSPLMVGGKVVGLVQKKLGEGVGSAESVTRIRNYLKALQVI